MKYRCKHCKKIVDRDSKKKWIKSYCDETGKTVHLQRCDDDQKNNKST